MTATDELRRMLDERGVEYEVRVENITGIEHIIWHPNEFSQWDWNEEFGAGWLNGWQQGVTPEQAIAATLGPCSDSCNCTNGERTDLVAENARLRAMRDTWAENDARLRELVRDMWFWGYEGHMNSKSQEWQMKHIDGVLDRMRELGVEVGG